MTGHPHRSCPGEYSTQTVSDEVYAPSSFCICALYCYGKLFRKHVGAIIDDTHPGEVWTIADAGKPAVELGENRIGAQQAGDDDDR